MAKNGNGPVPDGRSTQLTGCTIQAYAWFARTTDFPDLSAPSFSGSRP